MPATMLKKSFVKDNGSTQKGIKKIAVGKLLRPSASLQDEIKRIMIEEKIDLRLVLKRYKSILIALPDKVNASDVLKAGETLMRLWGVKTEDDQTILKVGAILQSKSPDEMRTFIMELSTRTQGYLNKIREPSNNP